MTTSGKLHQRSSLRKSNTYVITKNDKTLVNISKKIKNFNDWHDGGDENFQITKYDLNEFYGPHYDAFDIMNLKRLDKNIQKKGQRIITNILYLNDVIEGGFTYFNKLNVSIKPKTGRLLTFTNCIKNTNYLNPFSIHESTKVVKGEKWILSFWLREH
jgi:prolyl 4-hydroxylase